jgi:hypothetical protein
MELITLTSLDKPLIIQIIAQCFIGGTIGRRQITFTYADYISWRDTSLDKKFYGLFVTDYKLMYYIMMVSTDLCRIAKLIVPLVFNRDFHAPIKYDWSLSYYYNNRNFAMNNSAHIGTSIWSNFDRLVALNECTTMQITQDNINYLIAKGLWALKIMRFDDKSNESDWNDYLSKIAVRKLCTNINNLWSPQWENIMSLKISNNFIGQTPMIDLRNCKKLQLLTTFKVDVRGMDGLTFIIGSFTQSIVYGKLPSSLQVLRVNNMSIKKSLGDHLVNLESLHLYRVQHVTFVDVPSSPLEFMMVDGVKIPRI